MIIFIKEFFYWYRRWKINSANERYAQWIKDVEGERHVRDLQDKFKSIQ